MIHVYEDNLDGIVQASRWFGKIEYQLKMITSHKMKGLIQYYNETKIHKEHALTI